MDNINVGEAVNRGSDFPGIQAISHPPWNARRKTIAPSANFYCAGSQETSAKGIYGPSSAADRLSAILLVAASWRELGVNACACAHPAVRLANAATGRSAPVFFRSLLAHFPRIRREGVAQFCATLSLTGSI
jgi:hypothetical protein